MPIEDGPQLAASEALPSSWLRYGTGSARTSEAAALGEAVASVVARAKPMARTRRKRPTSDALERTVYGSESATRNSRLWLRAGPRPRRGTGCLETVSEPGVWALPASGYGPPYLLERSVGCRARLPEPAP